VAAALPPTLSSKEWGGRREDWVDVCVGRRLSPTVEWRGEKGGGSNPPSLSPLAGLYTRFHQFHYRPLLNNKPDLTHSLPSLSLSHGRLCVCVCLFVCVCVWRNWKKKKRV
jgi:hypothetical protein